MSLQGKTVTTKELANWILPDATTLLGVRGSADIIQTRAFKVRRQPKYHSFFTLRRRFGIADVDHCPNSALSSKPNNPIVPNYVEVVVIRKYEYNRVMNNVATTHKAGS